MSGAMNCFFSYVLILYGLSVTYGSLIEQTKYSNLNKQSFDPKADNLNFDEIVQSFNRSHIYKIEVKMYFDIGIFIAKDLYKSLNQYVGNVDLFFAKIATEISRIFSWNNIESTVKQFDVLETDNNTFDDKLSGFYDIINNLKENIANPLDYYIFYTNLTSKDWHGHTVGSLRCTGLTFNLQNIQYIGELTVKNIAETTAMDILLQRFSPRVFHVDCECPYENFHYCISDLYESPPSNELITKIINECDINSMLHTYGYHSLCLFKKHPSPPLYIVCGDGVVHETEECDCGTEVMCRLSGQDNCCDHTICRFKKNHFQCSIGDCCKNCLFTIGTLCRVSYGECDPVELCDGTSSECPIDYVYDHYTMCNDQSGMCINGMCSNFDSLCKYVYQREPVYFDEKCYDFLLSKFLLEPDNIMLKDAIKFPSSELGKCTFFICASDNELLRFPETLSFQYGEKYCMIPNKNMSIGWFQHSPNYLKCGNDNKHYCYDSICTDDIKLLKNCQDGYCRDIDNTIKYEMNLYYIFQAQNYAQTLYNYGIYLNTKAKKIPVKITKTLIIIFTSCAIIILTIIITLIFFRTRKYFLFYFHGARLKVFEKKQYKLCRTTVYDI